jgi:NAD(P)-dependent dehydrogenase (short-subunit alcohol dehydrogenase family)
MRDGLGHYSQTTGQSGTGQPRIELREFWIASQAAMEPCVFSLQDKNALVTGGTAGIGLAVAESFVAAGAAVTITGRRDGNPIAAGFGATFLPVDVRDEAAIRDTLAEFAASVGPVDVLVLNSGVAHELSIAELSSQEFKNVFDVNVNGVFYGLKHAQPHMRDGGSIIVTSSTAATLGSPESSAYSASKAAASHLARCAAIELGSRGIRVNAVCPGGIKTDMALPDEIFEVLAPLGRIGQTDDLIGIYNLLASDASKYISGQSIAVDGGLTAGFTPQLLDKIFQ